MVYFHMMYTGTSTKMFPECSRGPYSLASPTCRSLAVLQMYLKASKSTGVSMREAVISSSSTAAASRSSLCCQSIS